MLTSPIPTILVTQESRSTQVFYNNMTRLEERRKKEKESQSQMKFWIKASPTKITEYARVATDSCSICFEHDVISNLFKTTCGHRFHKNCLQTWCDNNDSCPNCRQANPFNRTQKKLDFNQPCPSIDFAGQQDTLHNPYNNINNYNINNYIINFNNNINYRNNNIINNN